MQCMKSKKTERETIMKKNYLALMAAAVLTLAVALNGCGKTENPAADGTGAAANDEKSEGVMTYAEYIAADLDTQVVVETYVQAKQAWWEDTAPIYTQDKAGAYFIYGMAWSS